MSMSMKKGRVPSQQVWSLRETDLLLALARTSDFITVTGREGRAPLEDNILDNLKKGKTHKAFKSTHC